MAHDGDRVEPKPQSVRSIREELIDLIASLIVMKRRLQDRQDDASALRGPQSRTPADEDSCRS